MVRIKPVGNFCAYPRRGVFVASPVGGWPHDGWRRAAKALGLETEAGGVVVGAASGYQPEASVVESHPVVDRMLGWLARHPEAAESGRVRIREVDSRKFWERSAAMAHRSMRQSLGAAGWPSVAHGLRQDAVEWARRALREHAMNY